MTLPIRWPRASGLLEFLAANVVLLLSGARALTATPNLQIEAIQNNYIVLSSGAQSGVREGMIGRVIATETVGGTSVELILGLFRVVNVEPSRSSALLTRGRPETIQPGMSAVFDPAVHEERQQTPPSRSPVPGKFVDVPPGAFVMGCQAAPGVCAADERPAHAVVLSRGFAMMVAEVTNGEYRKCTSAGSCTEPVASPHLFQNPVYDDLPVLGITWAQARQYCTFVGGRLPTEAEWEYAALGGAKRPALYPWGDDEPACWGGGRNGARFDDDRLCNDAGPAVVGSFEPNGFGLYDMAGNAWEWTADLYDDTYFSRSPRTDPLGPVTGTSRVVRGGSWSSSAGALRSANRLAVAEGGTSANIGVRCVREK